MLGSSRRLAFAAVLIVTFLGAACASPRLAGGVRSDPLRVTEVVLPDASNGGEPMAMRAKADELLLVYFGYTSCPDICPTTMADVGRAIKDLPADLGPRVDMAMVTLDPDRDTPDRLTQFLAYFFARSHALRAADAQQLADAAAAFEVRWEVEPHQPGDPYKVSHTAVTYAVDDTGTVLVEWPFGTNHELIRSDLAILLAR